MRDDCEFYGHDLGVLMELRKNNPPAKIPWHKSEAKALLEEAINNKKHLTQKPEELYGSKPEFREYRLEQFRKHLHQELDKRTKHEHRFSKKKTRPREIDIVDAAPKRTPKCTTTDNANYI